MIFALFLSSCTTQIDTHVYEKLDKEIKHDWPITETEKGTVQSRYPTELGIKALKELNFHTASDSFNTAIRLSPQNSYLHYLNGLTYHMWGLKQDPSQLPNAEIGYVTALRFDPGNTLAAYNLGQYHMDSRDFTKAQNQFANGLLSAPFSEKFLLGLAVSSYMNQDVLTAYRAIEVLEKINCTDPCMYRAAAFINAAANEPVKAEQYLEKYIKTYTGPNAKQFIQTLRDRLQTWKDFYSSFSEDLDNLGLNNQGLPEIVHHPLITKENLPPPENIGSTSHKGTPSSPHHGSKDSSSENAPKESSPEKDSGPSDDLTTEKDTDKHNEEFASEISKKMIVLDVMILMMEKIDSTSYGNNLLNVLSLTSASNNLASFNWNSTSSPKTTKLASINLQMLQYSLNIANDTTNHNEILSSPSLIATHGKQSNFFSGNDLTLALTSTQGGGNLVSKEVGISLTVTPFFLKDDQIVLDVVAARTLLDTTEALPGNLQSSPTPAIQTVRSSVSATSILSAGESLVLSGMNERFVFKTRNGVPILGDIPLASYFFSSESLQTTERSIVFIISPHFSEKIIKDEAGNWIAVPVEKQKTEQLVYLKILKSRYPDLSNIAEKKPYLSQLSSPYLSRNFRPIDMPMKQTTTPELSQLLNEVKQYF